MPQPTTNDIISLGMMIRGRIIVPGSILYEAEAKKNHNAMLHTNKPLFYVYCKDVADVREVLKFIVTHNLELSIRSGGHSLCGSSLRDGSVVVDVGSISHVDFDEKTQSVSLGPGATLGDVNVHLLRHGRMTPLGYVPSTGCGGLVTQGGVGWLLHRYGTSVDNITAMTMVLADGSVKNLNNQSTGEDRDLFFAARGASGILGIVTSITMRTYPMEEVTGGMWAMLDDDNYTKTKEYVRRCRNLILEQEEKGQRKLFGGIYMANLPPAESIPDDIRGRPCTIFLIACWGTDDEAKDVMKNFTDGEIVFGNPPGQMPFNIFNQILSGMFMTWPALGSYWKTSLTVQLSDENIDSFCDKFVGHETWLDASFCGFDFQGGNEGREHGKNTNEGNDNCVPSLRDYYFLVISALYFPPEEEKRNKARLLARDMTSVFEEQRITSYSNFLVDLENEEAKTRETNLSFKNADRIQEIKKRVDPGSLFTRSVISIGKAETIN